MLKKILSGVFLCLFSLVALAGPKDEGMWLPMLLKQMNEADMKAKGLKLSADDIYNANKSSLKDAIVSFGGFCTGELVSPEGLLLTNHHCGYKQIQYHSSVEKDYLKNGYWAMNREQELPNPGLTATFIVRMEDVTGKILSGIDHRMAEAERQALITKRISQLQRDAVADSHYEAIIRPFYGGNEYYMFITETFKDVRMVGAPPSAIGKFGGDTDNWMWPRHTGDFSVFRIYAGKDNRPAEYSKDNVPYRPKHFLPISLKGVQKGDFTMVYGFPGRTQQYLTSHAVQLIMEESNPHRVAIRAQKLEILDAAMSASDEIRIQYASKQASLANAYKKWIGETRGLKRLNAIEKKKQQEEAFRTWVNGNKERSAKYGSVLPGLEKAYQELKQVNRAYDYFQEAVMGVELMTYTSALVPVLNALEAGNSAKAVERFKTQTANYFKNYHLPTDKKLFAALMEMYHTNVPKEFHPAPFTEAVQRFGGDFTKYAEEMYSQSLLTSPEKVEKLLGTPDGGAVVMALQDPAFALFNGFAEIYHNQILPVYMRATQEAELTQRLYIAGLREMNTNKKFYPDANSTLRVTYGKVDDYQPRDGVRYEYATTLEGVMEKEDPAIDDYEVPAKLKELYRQKEYGRYGVNGAMPLCFIASNHTTGGNSGSPVLNAEGHLIGINFDRNWEGTMSDIMYDPNQVRNIALDMRYVLFVIDKFAGAGHLVKEMKIIQ